MRDKTPLPLGLIDKGGNIITNSDKLLRSNFDISQGKVFDRRCSEQALGIVM
jgi:hypothetical protein